MDQFFGNQASSQAADDQLPPIFLIVGLGNPGRDYRNTRHNIGFMAVDALASELKCQMTRVQFKAIIGSLNYGEKKVILAKPQTFMNLSGVSVSSLLRYYKICIPHLLVIHDDLDLPLGTIRIRPGGGSAGQRGMESIIENWARRTFRA